ncbi:MAG: molybdenum cofactor guanylyltransferase [Planctomycetota bacterium]|jgi:molybdopterin-guanine dinucleotide biosynthesis protein A
MIKKSKRLTVSGVILAGGDARRIEGIAKGTLEVDSGISIIEHLINELNGAGISNVVIAANDPRPYQDYGVEIIADIRTGIGPMGGIESGLAHFAVESDAVMFVPCDLPNITASEMSVLKEKFIESDARVVFAETSDFFWHPLCVVVHNGLLKDVSAAIDRGERKIRNVWREAEAVRVRFAEEVAFFNINSLTDVDKWRKVKDEKENLHRSFNGG